MYSKRESATKPIVKGPIDGNAFCVIGAVQAALQKAGENQQVIEEMLDRTFASRSYNNLLVICQEYVDFDL